MVVARVVSGEGAAGSVEAAGSEDCSGSGAAVAGLDTGSGAGCEGGSAGAGVGSTAGSGAEEEVSQGFLPELQKYRMVA